MRFSEILTGAALVVLASSQTPTPYYDSTSGISYSSVTQANGVTFRVALPVAVTPADAILQVIAPVKYGWCGFAWGGHMINNPLSVSWPTGATTGQKSIVSSRMALGYTAVPSPYPNATYTPIKGPAANSTHWTLTTRCQGCTIWSSSDGDFNIQNETEAVFAYACSSTPPVTPSSNTSDIQVHEEFGIWGHDLSAAKNASFSSWVKAAGNASVASRFWA
ncbi:iron reductase domain protein [Lophiostoma macrostomum CBS 122681]|uniref:Iron reductase domain protein n=1 Tax=Lophiostoma macrostomum CBS 122681 TaxID=1314788 RepID=A0A6A6SZG4_9PLEO|nr:iron reductase domain protein [Lophiostoma macrostomum CBS 122681]